MAQAQSQIERLIAKGKTIKEPSDIKSYIVEVHAVLRTILDEIKIAASKASAGNLPEIKEAKTAMSAFSKAASTIQTLIDRIKASGQLKSPGEDLGKAMRHIIAANIAGVGEDLTSAKEKAAILTNAVDTFVSMQSTSAPVIFSRPSHEETTDGELNNQVGHKNSGFRPTP